jgi:hypothetical protein
MRALSCTAFHALEKRDRSDRSETPTTDEAGANRDRITLTAQLL